MEEEEKEEVVVAETVTETAAGEAAALTGPEPEIAEEEGEAEEKAEEKAEEAEAALEASSDAEAEVAVVVASPPLAEEQEGEAPPEVPAEKDPDVAAEEPPLVVEGEEEAEEAAKEGKAEGAPEGEVPEQEAPEGEGEEEEEKEKEKEEEEEEPKPPEEAAPSEEAPQEEKPAAEGDGEGEGEQEGGEEESQEPSPTLLLAPPPTKPEVPIAVTFAEGAGLSPMLLGADLNRQISQSLWELDKLRGPSVGSSPESAGALSPERETEEQLAARRAEEQRHRQELIEEFRQLQAERRHLRNENLKVQSKLGELLGRGGKESAPRPAAAAAAELEHHISDREQRYSRYLATLEELRAQQAAEGAWYRRQLEALHASRQEKLGKVQAEWQACQAIKKEVAVFTMGRRLGGKQAAKKEVDHIQAREQAKEDEMTEVRLEYIKLKHRIQKLEASLKAQEELAEGLHLIDFEQLKIENQTYNEKIEERNEELLKLRRKITNTVQIISQVKEKLQFVEAENQIQNSQLMAAEALVAQRREILTKTRQARDKLRLDNERLQQKCGLLGHTLLLRDYENKVNAAEALKERLEILKRRHAGLSLSCKGVKRKLEGVTSFLPM